MSSDLPIIDFRAIGPAVGDLFPNIQLPNQHGDLVDLHQVRAGKRALIVFHRSASW